MDIDKVVPTICKSCGKIVTTHNHYYSKKFNGIYLCPKDKQLNNINKGE